VQVSAKEGYIDKTGTMIIEPRDWDAGEFSEGLARITFDDGEEYKSGFIDKSGDMVIPARFDGMAHQEHCRTALSMTLHPADTRIESGAVRGSLPGGPTER
jgi:hypothetical protein